MWRFLGMGLGIGVDKKRTRTAYVREKRGHDYMNMLYIYI